MSKILLGGDAHGERGIREILKEADKHGATHAIVVGDCWDVHYDYSKDYKAKPLYLAGNHEQPLNWEISRQFNRGVLENFSTFNLHGVMFGVIDRIDETNHAHLKETIPWLYDALGPKPDIWMDKPAIETLPFEGIHVLLTHDSPYPIEFVDPNGDTHVSGSEYLRSVIEMYKPKYNFSGHYHGCNRRTIHDTDCVGLNQQNASKRYGFSKALLDTETMEIQMLK